jgi:hypothetical protein
MEGSLAFSLLLRYTVSEQMSNTELYGEEYRDTERYLKCMWEVRDRINLISSVVARQVTVGREDFAAELIFLQFRKVLELIAFASLTANRAKYSAAHARFAEHWRAKDMLKELAKINPDFYPMPLGSPVLQNGVKHCPAVTDGFLTKDDFAVLYGHAGDILHARNPFTIKPLTVNIGYSVPQWVSRIQTLLGLHVMHLVDGKKWIVEVPGEGQIHVFPAEPT